MMLTFPPLFAEMRFPAPKAVPPIRFPALSPMLIPVVLPRASVPEKSVPMKLP